MRWLQIPHLQTLRDARFLRSLMLVWFAFVMGAAIASPWVNPQALELICSGSGAMKLRVMTDDGTGGDLSSGMLDCPLCATVGAPLPVDNAVIRPAQSIGPAAHSIPAARQAAPSAAPLPARGPPAFS